jgi:hypothetical protein
MTLAPKASIVLGNEQYDSHAVCVVVTLAPLPAIGSFTAVFPPAVTIDASAGDAASLDLDGGEGSETVLTGMVRVIRRGIRQTEVIVADSSAALVDLRPATTYRNQSADDVIRALASDAGVTIANTSVDLPMAAYVADQRRTATEHIAMLAALGGAMARVNGDGELEVSRSTAGLPDLAIKYGREVIACDVRVSAAPVAHRIRTGSGPAGSAMAPNALRPSKDPLPNGASDPGADAVWTPAAVLRTPSAAATASAAADLAATAAVTRLRASAFLVPKLRPGLIVDIQDLPDALAGGPWLLTRVTHVLNPRDGGRTYFEGEEASSLDLSALAGAALSAIGGLL